MVQIKLFIAFILAAAIAPAIALPVPVDKAGDHDRELLLSGLGEQKKLMRLENKPQGTYNFPDGHDACDEVMSFLRSSILYSKNMTDFDS